MPLPLLTERPRTNQKDAFGRGRRRRRETRVRARAADVLAALELTFLHQGYRCRFTYSALVYTATASWPSQSGRQEWLVFRDQVFFYPFHPLSDAMVIQ